MVTSKKENEVARPKNTSCLSRVLFELMAEVALQPSSSQYQRLLSPEGWPVFHSAKPPLENLRDNYPILERELESECKIRILDAL